MKSKFLTYAFLFTLLVVVFQYVNSKQIIDKYEKDIKAYKIKIEQLELENTALKAKFDANDER
jgi:cell division protein FtsB